MKKFLTTISFLLVTSVLVAQTEKKESWYFKIGGSYFMQTAATEFPSVGGKDALDKVYQGGKLVSEESITGSFGEGFRTGITAGYRFNERLGVEMGINYYNSIDKTMAKTTTDVPYIPTGNVYNFTSVGQITAFDLAPAVVLFLGEHKGFEPYTKVGVLVPVHGDLEITTDALAPVAVNPATGLPIMGQVRSKDVVKPNPTIGFSAVLGTSYKIGKNLSLYAELEYRNFTVHGKTKETTMFTVNGEDKLSTRTYSQIHTNYVDKLTTTSNAITNPNGVDTSKALNELSSYVGISGLGMTVGLKYSL